MRIYAALLDMWRALERDLFAPLQPQLAGAMPLWMAIDDDRLDTAEGGDLIQGVKDYLTAHPASETDTWFSAVRVFDVLQSVATELAPDAVSYDNLVDAEIAILYWTAENEQNRPARFQLSEFVDEWDAP